VFLNDWSHGTAIGKKGEKYLGTVAFAADEVLELLAGEPQARPYSPQAWHDLESVVKLVFSVQSPFEWECQKLSHRQAKAMLEFWKRSLALSMWTPLTTAARGNRDPYEALKVAIRGILT
jgi:hypothetical protein